LRLSRQGSAVETSEGAHVPVDAARMLWRLVARCACKGEALHTPPPVQVGAFQLGRIDANGDARVGCHFITYAEASRFAAAQGWPGPSFAAAGGAE
jgi:hypothetical protein